MLLCLLVLVAVQIDSLSIHSVEYFGHLSEARFSPVPAKISGCAPLVEARGARTTFYDSFPYWPDTTQLRTLDLFLVINIACFSTEINGRRKKGLIYSIFREKGFVRGLYR